MFNLKMSVIKNIFFSFKILITILRSECARVCMCMKGSLKDTLLNITKKNYTKWLIPTNNYLTLKMG